MITALRSLWNKWYSQMCTGHSPFAGIDQDAIVAQAVRDNVHPERPGNETVVMVV
jgi:hypothetical protein